MKTACSNGQQNNLICTAHYSAWPGLNVPIFTIIQLLYTYTQTILMNPHLEMVYYDNVMMSTIPHDGANESNEQNGFKFM